MHLHDRVQKAAECTGISHAVWLTETAKERLGEKYDKKGDVLSHEGPAPDWDCSCGHYFTGRWRTQHQPLSMLRPMLPA